MTEQEWLVCNDPQKMLQELRADPTMPGFYGQLQPSDRKLRLFFCACVKATDLFANLCDVNQKALQWCEDNDGDAPEVPEEERDMWSSCLHDGRWDNLLDVVQCHNQNDTNLPDIFREIFNPFWRRVVHLGTSQDGWAKGGEVTVYAGDADPRWLTWHDGTVTKLAEGIYQDKAWERMPILADALEEAGCIDVEILNHCRGLRRCPKWMRHYVTREQARKSFYEGSSCNDCCKTPGWVANKTPHYRGYWVLDLLTGRN